ncbi:MAG: GntR family transcriptional regulator [Bacteroidetes bacterium]|nr:GntR family transcriptional regulator [Bacteroidota bacterium]
MKLSINHQSKLPLHIQVEELLRKLIEAPEFRNGKFLPKEVELANQLGVSRNTIRQATNKLEHEGLLIRKKGVGTTVGSKIPLSTGLEYWYSFTQEMKQLGIDVINLKLQAQFVLPDEHIAGVFKIRANKKLLKLSKLKGTGTDPIVYFESYFHPRIGVQEQDDFTIPLYVMLEKKYGVKAVRSFENIKAILAGPFAPLLKLRKNDPVLFRERFVYDPGDRLVEYNLGYYRPDRFTYSINLKR